MTIGMFLVAVIGATTLHAGIYADRYASGIAALDTSKPESACAARNTLREMLPRATDADRLTMFRAFASLLDTLRLKTSQDFSKSLSPVGERVYTELTKAGRNPGAAEAAAILRSNPEFHRPLAPWLDCGFSVMVADSSLIANSEWPLDLAPLLPREARAWVQFKAREDRNEPLVIYDAGVLITWQQLGERLARWEDFARQNPAMAPEIGPEIQSLAEVFVNGIDNNHIATQNGEIYPDVLNAWRRYIRVEPASPYASFLRQWLNRFGQPDFRLAGAALDDWLRQLNSLGFR